MIWPKVVCCRWLLGFGLVVVDGAAKMKLAIYQQIVDIIQSGYHKKKQGCLERLKESFPRFHEDTFHSIYSQELQRKIKHNIKNHRRAEAAQAYYERCMKHFESDHEIGIILRIAEEVDFPPVMIARIILGEYLKRTKYSESGIVPKGQVSLLLKDTQLIKDETLGKEVDLCLRNDDDCGPENDAIKRKVGEEYEKKLEEILIEKDIPFLDEEKLRVLGYDKTPDYKLEVPIAVDGHVINWIESKASFGDEESHANYLKDQFWSYTNRFGSGMVIYWFGYIDELDNNRNRGIVLHDKFPDRIITLDELL
eukprot:Seg1174.6 transcript_id=Seg1174.6/GoldUCD/mRNA.D3Y31 product="putative protein C15orf41-like" protein_id=Seg1174.6/GoldUCD/D3Y31